MPNKKSLVLFDIDGTLTDSVELHQKAFRDSLAAIGVSPFHGSFHSFQHHTDSHIARVLYETEHNRTFKRAIRQKFEETLFELITAQKVSEIPGAAMYVKSLEESEYAVCFATGSLLRAATHKLRLIGLSVHVELLVASDEIEERENIIVQAICKARTFYQVKSFDRIVSIGDGLWDLLAAKKLNLDFIGIGASNKHILQSNGMRRHFENFENLSAEDLFQR